MAGTEQSQIDFLLIKLTTPHYPFKTKIIQIFNSILIKFSGLLALVELTKPSAAVFVDVQVDSSQLSARSSDEPSLISKTYNAPGDSGGIRSVTVMAGCQGYVGTVFLSEMRLQAENDDGPVEGGPCYEQNERNDLAAEGGSTASKPVYLLGMLFIDCLTCCWLECNHGW